MGLDILSNLISDVIFLIILIAAGWVIFYFSRRLKLLKFFGTNESRRIVVYLSILRVKSFGAIGIDGRERSYSGSAGAFGEIQVANRFRELFNFFLPSLSDNPGILSKILISDMNVQILPSPLDAKDLDRNSQIIAIGSPAYNAASEYIESELHSQARINPGISFSGSIRERSTKEQPIPGTAVHDSSTSSPMSQPSGTADAFNELFTDSAYSQGVEFRKTELREKKSEINVEGIDPISDSFYCFVERIQDKDRNRSVFYVAGLSEWGTMGAANYLQKEWLRLYKKYGDETDFLVMLRVEPSDYKKWTRIFER